jgi:hypothetical protein
MIRSKVQISGNIVTPPFFAVNETHTHTHTHTKLNFTEETMEDEK